MRLPMMSSSPPCEANERVAADVALSIAIDAGQAARPALSFASRFSDVAHLAQRRDRVAIWITACSPNGPDEIDCGAGGASTDDRRWAAAAASRIVRGTLGHLLGVAPAAVAIKRTTRGKPVLDSASHGDAGAQWHFSTSYAPGLAAVAFSRHPVGIDIEHVRPFSEMHDVARATFGPEMTASLIEGTSEIDATRLFFRYWTICEAIAKATGDGMIALPADLYVTRSVQPRLLRIGGSWGPADRWHLLHRAGPVSLLSSGRQQSNQG